MWYRRGRSLIRIALFICLTTISLQAQSSDALAEKSHQAKELMSAGRFADAVPIYQDLCRAIPDNAGLRLNLALAYHMSGQHREAVPEFERVLKTDPSNFPALLSLGASFLALNEPAKAIPLLTKVVGIQPGNVNARGMLANALLSQGRAREAVPHFRQLTAQRPEDAKGWFGLGKAYETLASDAFQKLDKTSQGSAEWLALVADSRMTRRQYRSAFYFYKQALEKNPVLPGLHTEIADLYRRTDHPDWAAAEERKSDAMNCVKNKQACDFAAGRYTRAASGPSLYWQTRAYNELALDAFKALGKVPASVEVHALKAEILASHGQHAEAAKEWEAALQLAPAEPRLTQQYAAALFEARDYTKAQPLVESLLKSNPNSPELNYLMGEMLLRSEQPDRALPWLETAARLNPAMVPAHASLGLAYMRLNRDADAVPHLKAALATDDDGSLHFQLARALQRVGDAEGSRDMMAKYSAIQRRSEAEQQNLEEKAQITAP